MEVHSHTHTPRKKWSHYFWEFLMLFLAVFCGFLAENQREHFIEHKREKQYIRSMIEDLQNDTSNLAGLISAFNRKELLLDSVIRGFDKGVAKYDSVWAQNFLRSFRSGFPDFFATDRTIQQLKNAGGLRLIRKVRSADGIIKYDATSKDVSGEADILSLLMRRYIEEVRKVWSIRRMYQEAGVSSWTKNRKMIVKNNYWITADSLAMEQLYNQLIDYNEAIIRQTLAFEGLKGNAIELIELLKKEYHMD